VLDIYKRTVTVPRSISLYPGPDHYSPETILQRAARKCNPPERKINPAGFTDIKMSTKTITLYFYCIAILPVSDSPS
jgi:hypothetical protein